MRKKLFCVLFLVLTLLILDFASGESSLLIGAVSVGDMNRVQLFLKDGVDVNDFNDDGMTALMVAAKEGHTKIVELLLEVNADVSIKRRSPLTKPIHYNYMERLEPQPDGVTALWIAACNGHIEIVKMLMDAKADINDENDHRVTVLRAAVKKGHIEIVRMLVDAEAYYTRKKQSGSPDSSSISIHQDDSGDSYISLPYSVGVGFGSTLERVGNFIDNIQLLPRAKSDDEKTKVVVPTAQDVTDVSRCIRFDDLDYVERALIDHISSKRFQEKPKGWVSTVIDKNEQKTKQIIIPVIETVLTQKVKFKDNTSNKFDLPEAYLIFEKEGQIMGVTPQGIEFDPLIIQHDNDVVLTAKKILKKKSIDTRKGSLLSGAVLIITPDVLEKDFNSVSSDLLRNVPRANFKHLKNLGLPKGSEKELTPLERRKIPFDYDMVFFCEKPKYMFERDPKPGEGYAKKRYSMEKMLSSKDVQYDFSPVVYRGPDTAIEKIEDTDHGFVINVSGREMPFEEVIAIVVSEKGPSSEVKDGEIIGIQWRVKKVKFAVEKNRVDDSEKVYINGGPVPPKYYHRKDCELLSIVNYSGDKQLAIDQGLSPCEKCKP
ncbi:MAG: ankyrin repeat domain-containing protein [Candidatus Omnitrophica bacterium]|nr:ankyrin repeat domain-containing protein [Candidatus Omnitrophota bacterium]